MYQWLVFSSFFRHLGNVITYNMESSWHTVCPLEWSLTSGTIVLATSSWMTSTVPDSCLSRHWRRDVFLDDLGNREDCGMVIVSWSGQLIFETPNARAFRPVLTQTGQVEEGHGLKSRFMKRCLCSAIVNIYRCSFHRSFGSTGNLIVESLRKALRQSSVENWGQPGTHLPFDLNNRQWMSLQSHSTGQ